VKGLSYFWSYSFVRITAGVLICAVVGVLVFVVVSGVIVRSRLKKYGGRALSIEQLNNMTKKGGGDG